MAADLRLAPLLSSLLRYALRLLRKCAISQVFRQLLQRVQFYWSIITLRRRRGGKGADGGGHEPPTNLRDRDAESNDDQGRTLVDREDQIVLVANGEVVHLDQNVSFSLFPYGPGGIRNASRSSQNLAASREAHSRAISLRSASRSNLGDSVRTPSPAISQIGTEDERYTFVVQPGSPTSPTPTRRFSHSLPDLSNPPPFSMPPLEPPSRYRPRIDTTPPRQPSRIIEHSEVMSPQEMEGTSISVPSMESLSMYVCLDNNRIVPTMPEANLRYEKRPRIHRRDYNMIVQPITTVFEKPTSPLGWLKYVHPEGLRYFYHEQKRVFTDADLFDSKILAQIMEDIELCENFITENAIRMPANIHLAMHLYYKEDDPSIIENNYYYVDHDTRTVFFLDTYDPSNLFSWYEISGCRTDSHLRHEIEAQYWYQILFFLLLYPHATKLSKAMVSELRDTVHHFIGDAMTSPTSTAPYTLNELNKVLKLTATLERKRLGTGPSYITVQGALYVLKARSRFLNFYGEGHARIERNFSVHGDPIHSRTWLVKSLSIILFSSPDFHLRTLQNMWVDGIMHHNVWQECMKKMNEEWQEFVLFATVMLNANVAFLAIQSVDINDDPHRSAAQIASYLSVVASIGSIVLGLLLTRQNRTKTRETVHEVQAYLQARRHPRLGLETLAILYSLPYALLMWGMVSFLAAFSFVFFADSSVPTRSLVGSLCFAVAILIIWCVYTSWEKHADDKPVEPSEPKPESTNSQRSIHSQHPFKSWREYALSKFLSLPAVQVFRRKSYDSEHTAVNERV
ncbi:hypothetical protein JR316_0009015 [Psilocybe cubensis]|uniref:Uncharacterized protein n=1 Tax=Psilocybe cubensis TaxID=181762 RepID=A0ACB8GSP9_PSICU|nr:hypothetical protein JR316_0009015 [Psilocybe cubensis]KAH9478558.1 hypothetical protein JR316_0009015 [Psilocybe cubensis]